MEAVGVGFRGVGGACLIGRMSLFYRVSATAFSRSPFPLMPCRVRLSHLFSVSWTIRLGGGTPDYARSRSFSSEGYAASVAGRGGGNPAGRRLAHHVWP